MVEKVYSSSPKQQADERVYSTTGNAGTYRDSYDISVKQQPAHLTFDQTPMYLELNEIAKHISVERAQPTVNIGRAADLIQVKQEPVQVQVQQNATDVNVTTEQQVIEVQQVAPEVEIEQYMPKFYLKMPPFRVHLEMDGAPEIIMEPYQPSIKVKQSDPIVRVTKPDPRVLVTENPPKIDIIQNASSVDVIPSTKASIQVKEDKPKITIQEYNPTMTFREGETKFDYKSFQPEVQWENPTPKVTVSQGEPTIRVSQDTPSIGLKNREPSVTINTKAPKIDVHHHPLSVSVVEPATTVHFGNPNSYAAAAAHQPHEHNWEEIKAIKVDQPLEKIGHFYSPSEKTLTSFNLWKNILTSTEKVIANKGVGRNFFTLIDTHENKICECFKEDLGLHRFNLNIRSSTGDLLFKGESQGRTLKLFDTQGTLFCTVECSKDQVECFNDKGQLCFNLLPNSMKWFFDIRNKAQSTIGALNKNGSKTGGYMMDFPRDLIPNDKMLLISSMFLIDDCFE
ncbi:hypothetical protein DDB_G0274337 [Dictyostelium discoideum AX4]|uniref:Tubby C-terminal domain-containing protein n=1 Tax=Dictyostelium discoideum TaxID=44689 RepID=Q86IY3_DICDI|nr:hypothetical protein DDB_G0274337 [Dictyostelium discoideum AX4]EAL70061.1 hypothetical protein DDB_G0274337 [Dictyostelium discoideum AX4]|eukprot:XP_643922.1 hypothetical protein DDB_G0274337 [Dictyostelium discoideum AX4]